jgi:subtilisin family serine protease
MNENNSINFKKENMNKTLLNIGLLLLTLAFAAYASSQSIWATATNISAVTSTEEYRSFENEYGLQITKPLSNSRQSHLQQVYEISGNCDVVDLYIAMHKVPGLSGIEYGPVYETLVEPNDYHTYTYYNNPSLTSDWHLDLIWAQAAWDVTHGTEAIAISDQNYWDNHEDLVGKILYYDTNNTLSQGHGTAVATAAAANTNNGVGISSIGYDSPLGLFRMNYNEVLQAAYDGYKVVNMSWTSGCNYNQYVDDALHEVYGLGVFLVASAGNGSTCGSPTELVYPAAYDVVFAVSSVDMNDSHDPNNNGNTHQHNSSVDLTAPGYNVPITAAPGWYLFGSGTSYASPIVAGTAGLIISAFPGISPAQIKYILQTTATNIDAQNPNYIGMLGAGRLNAGYAVKTALSYYISSQNSGGLVNPDKEDWDVDYEVMDDGNNGHGNDEGGVDPSNPGQGNGNNGNGRPNDNDGGLTAVTDKSMLIPNGVYDMSGKQVDLQYAASGIYLVIENGIVIRKIWK